MKIECNLTKILGDHNLTHKELSELSGIDRTYITRLCNGKLPNITTIFKLIAALRAKGIYLNINDLYCEVSDKKPISNNTPERGARETKKEKKK